MRFSPHAATSSKPQNAPQGCLSDGPHRPPPTCVQSSPSGIMALRTTTGFFLEVPSQGKNSLWDVSRPHDPGPDAQGWGSG